MLAALVRFSVRHAGVVLGLALALLGYGVLRLQSASLDVFPEFSPPLIVVQTEAPGMGADAVETLVTRPVEQATAGLAGLQKSRSQSIPGLSVVSLLFSDASSLPRNRQSVAERLVQASAQLPAGVVPDIPPLTSSASTVLGVGVTSAPKARLDALALRTVVDTLLRPQLLAVPGIADVNVFGGAERQWQAQVDARKLALAGLSIPELAAALRQATGLRGAGYVESANQRIALALDPPASRAGHEAEALGEAVIAQRGDETVRLRDVAQVVRAGAPAINGALIDGRPGVFLLVQGQLGANTRDATRALDAALAQIRPALERQGVVLHADLFRPAAFIGTAVGNVQRDLVVGAVLVVAVLFAFLYNVRTAVVSAVAIPLSLLAAVLVLQRFGIGLNIMVIGGLAIALGEVVDDAIIDCENIHRRLRENRALPESRRRPVAQVVIDASMEVRASVVYATFIVALVFVPLLTISGVAGRLFAPLGLAYIAAILASLLVALSVTPALALVLLGREGAPRRAGLSAIDPPLVAWLKPRYLRKLQAVERHSSAVLFAAGLAMATGIGLLPLLGGEFIPPLKEGHYIVHMTALPGTSLGESLRLGAQVSQAVLHVAGVKSVAQWVGRAQNGADTAGPNYSELEVEIGQLRGAEQQRILQDIRRTLSGDDGDADHSDERASGAVGFPGLAFSVNTFLTERIGETVSGFPADVVVSVYGPQLDALDRDAQTVAQQLAATAGTTDVQVLAPAGAPELGIRLRPDRLAFFGLQAGEVMDAVQMGYAGTVVGQSHAGDVLTPVALVLPATERADPGSVARLPLHTPRGELITLADVADVAMTDGRTKILHDGGRRVQTVVANLKRGADAEDVVARLRRRLGDAALFSPGDHAEVTGAAEAQAGARNDLLVAALLATVGVLALLMLAFGSLRHVLLACSNLPFALVGGVVAVLATGGWLSLGSVVGFVTLFGITLRNAIMLVSHCQHLVEVEGRPWTTATAHQAAQERLPSILMTAFVTGLGLLPLALGSAEPGREIEGPMATIIVGGLISSTVLNLLILPTVLVRFGRFGRYAEPGGEPRFSRSDAP